MNNDKEAIIALDGGGSNLRIVIKARDENETVLFTDSRKYGTNLTSVADKEKALTNIKDLIREGSEVARRKGYQIVGIGLSSAGTEVKENEERLKQSLEEASQEIQDKDPRSKKSPPLCVVINDINILLGKDIKIAGICGTGAIMAYTKKETDKDGNSKDVIRTVDGFGHYFGDYGSGYYIGDLVIKRALRIFDTDGYLNADGKRVKENLKESKFAKKVLRKIAREYVKNRDNIADIDKMLADESASKEFGVDQIREVAAKVATVLNQIMKKELSIQDLVKYATSVKSFVNGVETENQYDKAVVAKYAEIIAQVDDSPVSEDILTMASREFAYSIETAIKKAGFSKETPVTILLNGGLIQHNEKYRNMIQARVREIYPNAMLRHLDPKTEKAEDYTVRFVNDLLEKRKNERVADCTAREDM